ncbi:beta-mannosidase [Paenibacillus crassostreae]|uniref:Beta-mannosidase B n=1 Tax=Paenibacillus crassostreae TaxID=1763538 RepID=A0A167B9J9_9BACL|nr:glycoside hydrolase family 2 protein [Paenibacillus crassostreae]AOZ93052.1 beta-mannosidase [Paenibacillus crassostreae]OAB71860.1 beta-mannosidase [Paenibacillus crassostreae]
MLLDTDWKLKWFDEGEFRDLEIAHPDYIDHFWISTQVPGDVHSTLIAKNLIDDPFIGHNDIKCQWIEEKVWWYRTVFKWDKGVGDSERCELTFDGLDTFATIFLNGIEIGNTENMFISHTFDVTRELLDGKNVIAVKFDPLSKHIAEKKPNPSFYSSYSKERIWVRKAQMHFGWDWGPRLVAVGIWQPVRLERMKIAKLDDVFARTAEISETTAKVDINVKVEAFKGEDDLEVVIRLSDGEDVLEERKSVVSEQVKLTLEVENPTLWWTHDLGTPHLYKLEVELWMGNEILDVYARDFGIRTIEVMQKDALGNNRFTFVLNGVETFSKGANWIPVHSFFGASPDARYRHLISLSRESNLNMLRVWGGGIYEKDVFYEECDRQGLLVWQDFMFACALYPDFNKNFMRNVKEEIEAVVKRLRNYSCMAIWCGNNEIDWCYEFKYVDGSIEQTPFYGEKIFHELMPKVLKELDPTRLYWPSSPFGGNDHNDDSVGDRHNWQVWHGNVYPRQFGERTITDYSASGVSFKHFKNDKGLFISEFGMHASASRYTLERHIPEGQFYWGSDEMEYRNKDFHRPKGILLMDGYTGIPTDIEQYMMFSMLTQAEGLKYGIEHYRRNKPVTSGAIYWQLNDCWPGTSWAVIDYDLIPKAAYFYSKKFFANVLLTLDHDPGQDLKIWAVNDLLVPYEDVIELVVYDFDGNIIYTHDFIVNVGANAANQIGKLKEQEVLNGRQANDVVVVLRSKQSKAGDNYYHLIEQKHVHLLPVKLEVEVDEKQGEVKIRSDRFARCVRLELAQDMVTFSDNYCDLLPGATLTVKIGHLENAPINWDSLRISTLNDVMQ